MIPIDVFADPVGATVRALQGGFSPVSDLGPVGIPQLWIQVVDAGGGRRATAEATHNVGVHVHADSDATCRSTMRAVGNWLAATANSEIEVVQVPTGAGTVVPGQRPHRFLVATVTLAPIGMFEPDDLS